MQAKPRTMSSKLLTNKLIINAWMCSINKLMIFTIENTSKCSLQKYNGINKVEMIEFQLNVPLFSCGISHYQEHQLLSAKIY